MKRLMIIVLLAAGCTAVFAQAQGTDALSLEASRSIFSLDVAFAGDNEGSRGYSAFIKSASFIGDSPFYYGFGSLLGCFTTTQESFFETGVLVGYTNENEDSGLYYDMFLDLLVTGGRIDDESSLYRAEAPALHLGMSLGFPASSDIDGALSLAPVIRPYDLQNRTWDLSRSYINLGVTLRIKSLLLGRRLPWSTDERSMKLEEVIL